MPCSAFTCLYWQWVSNSLHVFCICLLQHLLLFVVSFCRFESTHMHICAAQQTCHWYPFQYDDCYFYHDLVFSFAAFHFQISSTMPTKNPAVLSHLISLWVQKHVCMQDNLNVFVSHTMKCWCILCRQFISLYWCVHIHSFSPKSTQQKENFSIESQNVTNRGRPKVDKRDCQKYSHSHFHFHSLTHTVSSMLSISFQLHLLCGCVSSVPFSAENCCISIGLLNWFFSSISYFTIIVY